MHAASQDSSVLLSSHLSVPTLCVGTHEWTHDLRAALEVLRLLALVYCILAVFTGDRILLLTMPSSSSVGASFVFMVGTTEIN